jgi:uncharacterized delta-60 repeat protein
MRTNKKPQLRLGCERLDDRLTPVAWDPGFGNAGFVNLPKTAPASSDPSYLLTTPDGGFLFAGENDDGLELFKLNGAGRFDPTFGGGDGRIPAGQRYTTPPFPSLPGSPPSDPVELTPYVTSSAVDSQGRILVVTGQYRRTYNLTGQPDDANRYTLHITTMLTRYLPDGTVDTSYGRNGTVTITNDDLPVDFGKGLAVTPDGSAYLGGVIQRADTEIEWMLYPDAEVNTNVQLVRITPNGTIDSTFGTNGLRSVELSNMAPQGYINVASIDILTDGDLLLVGEVRESEPQSQTLKDSVVTDSLVLVRLNSDGSYDPAYGINGIRHLVGGINGLSAVYDVSVLPDGQVIGTAQQYPVYHSNPLADIGPIEDPRLPKVDTIYAFRLTSKGQYDPTFSGDGKLAINSGELFEGSTNTSLRPVPVVNVVPTTDGGFYLVAVQPERLVIQKLTASGDVDESFSRSGVAVLPLPRKFQYPSNPTTNFSYSYTSDDLVVVGLRADTLPEIIFNCDATSESSPLTDPRRVVPTDLTIARIDLQTTSPELPIGPMPVSPVSRDIGPFESTLLVDLNGDRTLDKVFFNVSPTVAANQQFITGSAATTSTSQPTTSRLWVQDGETGGLLVEVFAPFEETFTGGLVVATGDLNGDGKAEIAIGPDVGGGARIQTYQYDGDTTLTLTDNFFAIDDVNFRGGARVALGDIDGDARMELIVGAGNGGGPRVVVYDGRSLMQQSNLPRKLISDFFAFPGEDTARLRDGVAVGAQDTNGDGMAELFFGAGPGGAPRVFVVDGALMAAGKMDRAFAVPVADGYVGGDSESRAGVAFFTESNFLWQNRQLRVLNLGEQVTRLVRGDWSKSSQLSQLFEGP